MNKKELKDARVSSITPIVRYSIIFCFLVFLGALAGGLFLVVDRMRENTESVLANVHSQLTLKVNEALTLLQSLAALPEYYDPSLPPIDKVRRLNLISPHYGYLMICYVDSEITVYSDGSEPVSLASRDYMQRLFSTGQFQVTDSFAAGADGMTLNYTVAVPLIDEKGEITGCLFCAIYFDEVAEFLKNSAETADVQSVLIGSTGQIMSATSPVFAYGDSYMDHMYDSVIFGVTADQLEERFLAQVPGSFWSIHEGRLYYNSYRRIDNTNWDVICSAGFLPTLGTYVPGIIMMSVVVLLLCAGLVLLLYRFFSAQKKTMDMLVQSIGELEKKIYQDEYPDHVDFNEIIRLTSTGLSDGLTGVVTRSVFLNKAETQLQKKAVPGKTIALCFVDMDNLKTINDTYGHAAGDAALKSIGYILREYEKKYDGVVGRYGGDEFVILLTDLDDEEELKQIMDEVILRLKTHISVGAGPIAIQCSAGVSVWHQGLDLTKLIANADEALYSVKQNGKGRYMVYQG